MLDEIEEVKAYLSNPNDKNPRIEAKLLSDNFKGKCKLNGLADILTLVVCHYLYDFCEFYKFDKAVKEKAILIMRIWCGFDNDVTQDELDNAKKENKKWFDEYPEAEGWLYEYYNSHLKNKSDDWLTYSEKWAKQLKSQNLYQAEAMCYENVLAQAITRGPLKKYNLTIKEDYETDIRNGKGNIPDARRKRNILKLIAAYKVLQLLHPGQKYVLLQTNRVLSWMGFDSDKNDRWCLDFTWRNEPLFLMESYGDFKKFSVNQTFLEEMDVQIGAGEFKNVQYGYDIYQDGGYGKTNALVKL